MSEKTEGEQLEEFGKQILRRPMKGAWESLLAQHLIQSTNASPLQKIRLICEAAYMSRDKVKVDFDLVDSIYQVTTGLQQTKDQKWIWVSWPFAPTRENYQKYIKPWRTQSTRYFRFNTTCDMETKAKLKKLNKVKGDVAATFFCWTNNVDLSGSTFQMLISEFAQWALPQAMTLFAELSKLVDPELYKDVLYAVSGKKIGGEE